MNDPIQQALEKREQSKSNLRSTVGRLKSRLRPSAIKKDATDKIKERAEHLAGTALEKAGSRPAVTAGVVAALTLFFLRKPLIGALKRLSKEK